MTKASLNNFNNILNFIVTTFKQFLEEGRKEFPFKIAEKKFCSKRQRDVLVIQLVGKALFVEKTAEEIVADDALLSGFSPIDSRAITFMACQEKFKPEEKIVGTEYSEGLDDILLHVKNKYTKLTDVKNAVEISKNKVLLNKFDKEDAHRIGYILGVKSGDTKNTREK